MLKSNSYSYRRCLSSPLLWAFLTLLILAPASNLYAQDPDEEEDLQEFFGDDEEFFEDEEEYLDDEELESENDWLNKGGKEGWELVNVIKDKSDVSSKHKMIYYFKRIKIK